MKTAIVLMLLMGCDCEGVQCEYIHAASTSWQSVEACRSAIDTQIKDAESRYPLVTASCQVQEGARDMVDIVESNDSTLMKYIVSTKNQILHVKDMVSVLIYDMPQKTDHGRGLF